MSQKNTSDWETKLYVIVNIKDRIDFSVIILVNIRKDRLLDMAEQTSLYLDGKREIKRYRVSDSNLYEG